MDPARLRKIVWEEMLFATMRANYFAELVGTYHRRDRKVGLAVLVFSSGAVATALTQLDPIVRLGTPICAAAGSFWLLLSQYPSLARDASELQSGWAGIAKDYEQLWNNLDSQNAVAEYRSIYDRAELLSKNGSKFPNKKGRLEHWLDHAGQIATARYA